MKITFLRQGHANNSSSSHSLIFTKQNIEKKSNESAEFGWNNFICSSKEDKTNYFICILRHAFNNLFLSNLYGNLPYNHENVRFMSEVNNFKQNLENRKDFLFQEYLFSCFKLIESIPSRFDGYIDHQSMICLPATRNKSDIHIEFAQKLYLEFIKDSWYIFGGNDNEEGNSPPVNDSAEFKQFQVVWEFLRDISPNSCICVKDDLTNEFVLSKSGHGAGLMKIKFD